MIRCLSQWTITLSVGLFLTACGGGGGGGSRAIDSMSPVSSDPLPTAAEVRDSIAAIGRAATSLTMSDLISTPRSRVFPNERIASECAGSGCEPEPSWGEPYYNAQELSVVSPDATLRIGDPQYGINNGEISGLASVQELDEGLDFSTDYRVYGGWLSENFFGVEHIRWRGRAQYGSIEGLETLIAYSAGIESGSNPVTGSAEWTGLVVALDRLAPDQAVNGQAALTYDFGDASLDVAFRNLRGAQAYADMQWHNLDVINGRFWTGDGANSLAGTFYGANHQEAGGVFERNQLIGAFGASRQ